METIEIQGKKVYGLALNNKTGCQHYHSDLDIIAIKFTCCMRYYACICCHEACECHAAEPLSTNDMSTKAVLCGNCGEELSISEYVFSGSQCRHCKAKFNPDCREHWPLYFCF